MWNSAIKKALLCTICNDVLDTPITLECGHTFCKSCTEISGYSFCVICGVYHPTQHNNSVTNLPTSNNTFPTNVLIQGFVNRFRTNLPTSYSEMATETCSESSFNARCRRKWSKIYKRRGKQHLEESIVAFSLAAVCESQNKPVRQVVGEVLQSLISEKRSFRSRCRRYNGGYSCSRLSRHHISASDSEEISSGDEDFIQGMVSSTDLKKLVDKIVRELENVQNPPSNILPPTISPSELDCVLCSRCLLEPVTTRCGHTFCRECLERVLDYGAACPLCVAPISRKDLSRGTTIVIERLLRLVIPNVHTERLRARQQEIENIDSQVPVFICTTAFPGIACPLFVYEPRYRLLTRRALQSPSRRFAIAAPGIHSNEKFAKYGTILEIKDAVRFQDGCSILTCVGLRRFRSVDVNENDGYYTASVQYIEDDPVPRSQLASLKELHNQVYEKAVSWAKSLDVSLQSEIEPSFGAMPPLEPNWHLLPDGPSWTWWLLAIFPLGKQLQVGILGATSLEKRLRAIEKTIDHLSTKAAGYRSELVCGNSNVDVSDASCNGLQHELENPQEPINL